MSRAAPSCIFRSLPNFDSYLYVPVPSLSGHGCFLFSGIGDVGNNAMLIAAMARFWGEMGSVSSGARATSLSPSRGDLETRWFQAAGGLVTTAY
jgi:hypothetical protein